MQGWRAVSVRAAVVVIVAFGLELVFGSRMAERLAGTRDAVAWVVGLAIAAFLTMSALSLARATHARKPNLLRGARGGLAVGVAVLAVVFLAFYAWGLGGGVIAGPTSGGLSGGTAVGRAPTAVDPPMNWGLTIIYVSLLLFLLATVVLSHLIDLTHHYEATMSNDMERKKRELSPADQVPLAIELLRQTLLLNEQAKHRARGLGGLCRRGPQRAVPRDPSGLETHQPGEP